MRCVSFLYIVNGVWKERKDNLEFPDYGIVEINLDDWEFTYHGDEAGYIDDCYLRVLGNLGSFGWRRTSDPIEETLLGRRHSRESGRPVLAGSTGHKELFQLKGTPSFSVTYYRGEVDKPVESLFITVSSARYEWATYIPNQVWSFRWPYGTDTDYALVYDPTDRVITIDSDCLANDEFSFPGIGELKRARKVEDRGDCIRFHPFDGQTFRIGRQLFLYSSGTLYTRFIIGVTLKARGLSCRGYHNRTGLPKVFLDDAGLVVQPGEIVAVIGESGGGKSTLLKALCGYCEASEGTVTLNEKDLYKDESLRSLLGYLPQADLLNEELTVRAELAYQAMLKCPKDFNADQRQRRIDDLLRRFDIYEERDSRISKLSGGQKKRVAIAGALLSEPSILFLDEPTSPLDPGMSGQFARETLVEISRGGCSVIFVTHDMDTLACADRVVWVHENRIAWDGTLRGLMDEVRCETLDSLARKLFSEGARAPRKVYEARTIPDEMVHAADDVDEYRKKRIGKFGQFLLCTRRSARLLMSNPANFLLVAMPVVIGLLMGLVGDADRMYVDYTFTKSMLFTFSAGSFFVGVFDSIQSFSAREHLAVEQYHGLSTGAYLLSTFLVQTIVCVVQTALLSSLFIRFSSLPDGQIISAMWDLCCTSFLCCESAMCMGLLASALVRRASNLAPVLVLVQIIFSGIIFPLSGVSEKLSYLISCKWAVVSLGALSDLNALKWKVATEEAAANAALEGTKLRMYSVIHDEPMYSPEVSVFLRGWIWMALIGVLLVVATYVVLRRRELSQYKILGPFDAQVALARRLKEAYLRIVLLALIVIGAIYLLSSGGLGHLLGMLGELRGYLSDVLGRLPEALDSAMRDFKDVFFG